MKHFIAALGIAALTLIGAGCTPDEEPDTTEVDVNIGDNMRKAVEEGGLDIQPATEEAPSAAEQTESETPAPAQP